MLDISEAQLRRWERKGLVPPAETFGFSDLIALRTLQKLRENGIPPRSIGRALASLKQKLSGVEHPLSELKIVSDGRSISVQVAGEKMEAVTGQFLFNFDTAELGGLRAFPEPRPPEPRVLAAESEAFFQKGLALEETGAPIEEATEAYMKAVELNPAAAGALLNLGTIHYRLRHFREAEDFYRRALEVDSRYALAHFNIGNLYDEMGNAPSAREHYQRALELNPHYADAHFNLALLCEKHGDSMRAVSHWKAYLKIDNTTPWADIARRQLTRLREATIVRSGSESLSS